MLSIKKNLYLFGLGFLPGIRPVFLFSFILMTTTVYTQENLVPNGSFEEYDTCPIGIADFSVKDWFSPTYATPDYFNSCASSFPTLDAGTPNNFAGYQKAYNGSGYVGFASCLPFDKNFNLDSNYREYIRIKLKKILKANSCFVFSCYLSLADSSMFCTGDIAFALTSNTLVTDSSAVPIYTNKEEILNNSPLCDTSKWVKFSKFFIASGDEKYLTIGIFRNDNNINYEYFNKNASNGCSYYYIDDVEIIEVKCFEVPNVFTPNNDGVNDKLSLMNIPKNSSFKILNRWGNIIFETLNPNQEFWDGTTKDGKLCSDGVYFYILDDADGNKKTGFVHMIR